MAFSDDFLSELVARSDITDIVSEYVQLTRKGSNYFGLCPFHSEKTASFSVSPDKQIYHCFGCGKGGGVVNFIMEIEGLSFPDAVAFLAKRAGLEVPDDRPAADREKRARLLRLNKDAARFFHASLQRGDCPEAAEYMAKRAISKGAATRFGVGAAPDSWDSLLRAMTALGYSKQDMLDVGLLVRGKNGGAYDRFRNRLMFPIIDIRGDVIGFGGRVLDDSKPKYLNSPESVVFNKSRNLFAMNLAKKSKAGHMILAEGYMDVLSLHQAGFDCAVASLGTSLTPDHGRLLSRYTKEVFIAYDSDEAGVKAAQRAIGILEKSAIAVKVIRMPGAKDPDEYIKKNSPEAFARLLTISENHIEYRLAAVKAKYDLASDDGRVAFVGEAAELLAQLPSAAAREVYGAKAAEQAGISAAGMAAEVDRARRKQLAAAKRKYEREQSAPDKLMQPQERTLRYENVRSAAAEEGIVRLLLLDPPLVPESERLSPEEFTAPFLGKAYELIRARYSSGSPLQPSELLARLSPEEASQISVILQKPESTAEGSRALNDYIEVIKTEKLKKTEDLLTVSEKYRQKKGYGG
ncbi:MAG: DNA primase [Oscillospiraceae bacterium]|nr:DNA primase [Oscillospiraceae bacterium]